MKKTAYGRRKEIAMLKETCAFAAESSASNKQQLDETITALEHERAVSEKRRAAFEHLHASIKSYFSAVNLFQ